MRHDDNHSGQFDCAPQDRSGRSWFIFDSVRDRTIYRNLSSKAEAVVIMREMMEGR